MLVQSQFAYLIWVLNFNARVVSGLASSETNFDSLQLFFPLIGGWEHCYLICFIGFMEEGNFNIFFSDIS